MKFLQSISGQFKTVEAHALIGNNLSLFNTTFAANLIGVGEGSYFGSGSQWTQCDD
jgi:hypothetical protein